MLNTPPANPIDVEWNMSAKALNLRAAWSNTVEFSIQDMRKYTIDASSGRVIVQQYFLNDSAGKNVPILDGTTSQYFLYQVGYVKGNSGSALVLTVINRRDLQMAYQSPGYLDFGLLELGSAKELLFATY